MAAYKTVPKTFLLLTQSICVSAVLICSHPNYLGSFGQLMCTGGLIRHVYTDPSGVDVVECALSGGGLCVPESVPASVINNTHTVLNITHIETTDAGEWSCSFGPNAVDKCVLTVVKTPTCSITSKQATDVLVQYQELTLTVDVRDYFCSTTHNVSLQTGHVTTLLIEADSVASVTDNTSSVTLNVTDSHLGTVELVFRCDSNEWNIACDGVADLVPMTPTCDITSTKDTEMLVLQDEVTLTVNILAYYDIRGSYCSVHSNFTLQTGDVMQLLRVGDQGFPPVTINVTEAHLVGVRLLFNCQDKHWNLTCGGVTELNIKINTIPEQSAVLTPTLVLGVIGAILFLSVVMNIALSVKLKLSGSAVHPPMDRHDPASNQRETGIRINPTYLPTAAVGDSRGSSNNIAITTTGGDYPETRAEYVALDGNAIQPSNMYEHLRVYEQIANM